MTVEEGSIGGFGSHVLHCLAEARLLDRGLKVRTMVLPDVFIDHGQPDQMYELAGLNASNIARTALAALGDASRCCNIRVVFESQQRNRFATS